MDANIRAGSQPPVLSSEQSGFGSTLSARLAQQLQHKPSMATTRSISSASSSSHRGHPTLAAPSTAPAPSSPSSHISPSRPSPYSETTHNLDNRTTQPKTKRVPVYVRIVPKDIWLRIHINPSQTIGSIKDAALFKANAPDHDPSLSYRFYQDAVNASAHAKIAPVAGHDKVVKHRSYALPRSFLCPPPDLSDVAATIAASVAHTSRSRKSSRSDYGQQPPAFRSTPQPVPPLPNFDNAYSPREAPVALPSASASQQTLHYGPSASPLSRAAPSPLMSRIAGDGSSSSARSTSGDDNAIGSSPANIVRQISNSTLATSTPSTSSDYGAASSSNNAALSSDASASDTSLSQLYAVNEIAIRLDASLITGDRNARLEEDQARTRLSQWNARRESTGKTTTSTQRDANLSASHLQTSLRSKSSPAHSHNSTPTIASSSTFDSDNVPSPNMVGSPSSLEAFSAPSGTLHPATAATPPRRPNRLNPGSLGGANPAIFYTQPGACESFTSLASVSSPSSAELLTTADDDALIMQWGTQAEESPLSDRAPSPTRSLASPSAGTASMAPLSSPLQPSTAMLSGSPSSASSPARPRSKTVTAADVLRSRRASNKDEVPPPPVLPEGFSSPVRISSLPRPAARKMVAESSQRREGPQPELLELLKGSARDPLNDDDEDEGFSTFKQQRGARVPSMPAMTLRKKSSDSSGSGAVAGPSSAYKSTPAAESSSERYIAGIRLDEISRGFKDASHPLSSKYAVLSSANGCELEEWKTVAASLIRPYELLELQWSIPTERVYIPPISLADTIRISTAATSHKSMFKQTWGEEADAGPDADALCLEPYFEGWVYVLKGGAVAGKTDKAVKASNKMGKWKLHFMTVKGWRIDLYRKKPRAGEAVLPVAEQVWSLRSIDWVAVDADHPIPANTALPGLETMPRSSVSIAFSPKGGGAATPGWMTSSPGALASASSESTLTLRCISDFDHQAMSTLLLRAWYRCSATAASSLSLTSEGVDRWRRKAVFRAVVAGRGGTVAAGRVGRGVNGGRNARARTRLRPSGWPREWEDADQWSSESEREEIAPPAELQHALSVEQQQSRRDTVTQAKADQSAAAQHSSRKQEADEKMVLPHGMYAALSGRSTATTDAATSSTAMSSGIGSEAMSPKQGSLGFASGNRSSVRPRHLAQSPSLPHMEPGLMLGRSNAQFGSSQTRRRGSGGGGGGGGYGRGGSTSRSPDAAVERMASSSSLRSPSLTVSSADWKAGARGRSTPTNSSPSSRNVSREASPLPSPGSSSRKGSGSGGSYNVSPALVPGFVDLPPPPSVMLLKKYKASQKAQAGGSSLNVDDTP